MQGDILNQVNLFQGLNSDELAQLQEMSIIRKYPEGQWITHYGSDWPYLFLVEKGQITAVKESPEGRTLVVMELDEGEVFWGVGFFREGIGMPVALIAEQATELRLWDRERLAPFLQEQGEMGWKLTGLMVERMLRASQILEEIAFQPVAGRLAHLILDQFKDQTGPTVARDLTLDEMAARIGSTREMVCRQLYKMADQGVIRINRTEITIEDLGTLKATAGKLKGGER